MNQALKNYADELEERFNERIKSVIIHRKMLNKTIDDLAKQFEFKKGTVTTIAKFYDLVLAGNFDRIIFECGEDVDLFENLVTVCAEIAHKEIPEGFTEKCEAAFKKRFGLKSLAEIAEEQRQEKRESGKEKVEKNEVAPIWAQQGLLLLRQIAENQVMQMDTVLPTHKEDVMRQMCANADMIALQLKDCLKALESIKTNTKRKGALGG